MSAPGLGPVLLSMRDVRRTHGQGDVSVLGALIGVLTGLMLGRVLVVAEQFRYDQADLSWQVVTPWSVVAEVGLGVPLLAMAGAFVLTRSRLPMVRRLAG